MTGYANPMKLIRRKQSKPPARKALDILALVARALMAQRVARKVVKHGARGYRWTRRLPYLLGGAAIVAVIAKLRGRSSGGAQVDQPYQPPAPVSSSTAAAPAPAPTPASPAAAESAPPPPDAPEAPEDPDVAAAVATADGAPATEPALDVEAPNEATPPAPADKDT